MAPFSGFRMEIVPTSYDPDEFPNFEKYFQVKTGCLIPYWMEPPADAIERVLNKLRMTWYIELPDHSIPENVLELGLRYV